GVEDHPDEVVLAVGDPQVSGPVDGQVVHGVELRLAGRHRAGVTGHGPPAAGLAVPGDGRDRPGGVDAADAGTGRVGGRIARLLSDVDVAEVVDSDAPRPVEV